MINWDMEITLDDINRQKQEQESTDAKAARISAINDLVVVVDGKEFQADEVSQQRILRQITIMQENDIIKWKLKDNSIVDVSKSTLVNVLSQAVLAVSKIMVS